MYKIMIIEDDVDIRAELKLFLENALYEVAEVTVFSKVVQQIAEAKPDLILLDLNLPEENGLTICSKLRIESEVPVIFVTSQNTSADELQCMMRGGDDYIAKPYNAPVLLARIAAVLKRMHREPVREINRLEHQGVVLHLFTYKAEYQGKEVELSKNELKILHYLFTHINQVSKRTAIIDYLWDNQVFIDDNTLSVNITRIRNKLEQIGVADFIETKRGMGYKI